jgi:hypothetical protein
MSHEIFAMKNLIEDLAFGLSRGLGVYFFQRNKYAAEALIPQLGSNVRR